MKVHLLWPRLQQEQGCCYGSIVHSAVLHSSEGRRAHLVYHVDALYSNENIQCKDVAPLLKRNIGESEYLASPHQFYCRKTWIFVSGWPLNHFTGYLILPGICSFSSPLIWLKQESIFLFLHICKELWGFCQREGKPGCCDPTTRERWQSWLALTSHVNTNVLFSSAAPGSPSEGSSNISSWRKWWLVSAVNVDKVVCSFEGLNIVLVLPSVCKVYLSYLKKRLLKKDVIYFWMPYPFSPFID